MSKEEVYRRLESRMQTYEDYADTPVIENGEALVPIIGAVGVQATIIRPDAIPVTGMQTYVRQGVLEGLEEAARLIAKKRPNATLDVGYGYRSLSVQRQNFEREAAKLADKYQGRELLAATHRKVAVPEVAGHPAGAAVDLAIRQNGELLDFGTKLWDFSKDSYTYSPYVSREARINRWLLLDMMEVAGFAPFLGEWWHFSYGDKEWASYKGEPNAIYDQLEFRATDI